MRGLTYGRLDSVLRSFGLRVQEVDGNTRVYTYPGTDALFTVPILPDTQEVSNFHVMGARMTLDSYGIADADEVTARMLKAVNPATAS